MSRGKNTLLRVAVVAFTVDLFALPARAGDSRAASREGEQVWTELTRGNQRFVAGKPTTRALSALRQSLSTAQHPKAIVLSCSDSRVPPEIIFDQSLGDLFVVRAAGNVADALGVGSIEYALDKLGSHVLVVLGHTRCGAVTAACTGERMPTPNLQAVVDKISPAVAAVGDTKANSAGTLEAVTQENVRRSAAAVLSQSELLRRAQEEGKLTVIEAEYALDTGEVVRLNGAAPKGGSGPP
jgi:carbonic anhydrase